MPPDCSPRASAEHLVGADVRHDLTAKRRERSRPVFDRLDPARGRAKSHAGNVFFVVARARVSSSTSRGFEIVAPFRRRQCALLSHFAARPHALASGPFLVTTILWVGTAIAPDPWTRITRMPRIVAVLSWRSARAAAAGANRPLGMRWPGRFANAYRRLFASVARVIRVQVVAPISVPIRFDSH